LDYLRQNYAPHLYRGAARWRNAGAALLKARVRRDICARCALHAQRLISTARIPFAHSARQMKLLVLPPLYLRAALVEGKKAV